MPGYKSFHITLRLLFVNCNHQVIPDSCLKPSTQACANENGSQPSSHPIPHEPNPDVQVKQDHLVVCYHSATGMPQFRLIQHDLSWTVGERFPLLQHSFGADNGAKNGVVALPHGARAAWRAALCFRPWVCPHACKKARGGRVCQPRSGASRMRWCSS